MIYLPELDYLQDQPDFPFRKAALVTATTVGQWCSHFHAKILVPQKHYRGPREKRGALPANPAARDALIVELMRWLFSRSLMDDLFYLLLDDRPIVPSDRTAKFDHHDDTDCWALNLTPDEFARLASAWEANGLPKDLFYSEEETRCIPVPGSSLKARLLRAAGVLKCYTPRQWEKTLGKIGSAPPPWLKPFPQGRSDASSLPNPGNFHNCSSDGTGAMKT